MKHNIIKTENYLLVVDDSKIKQNDFFYGVADGSIKPFIEIADENTVEIVTWQLNVIGKSPNKKIAAHLPLNNSPVLEGVPLLPPLEDEVGELAQKYVENEVKPGIEPRGYNQDLRIGIYGGSVTGFIYGYNKAKEKYKYTEEDLRKCWKACLDFNKPAGGDSGINLEDFIQSLQQPKRPVGFECEVERIYPNPQTISKEYDFDDILIERKTTTNSQGQTVLVGKYIY